MKISGYIHKVLKERIPKGGFCIDATCGRGNDTIFLAECVGENGTVTAIDIQQEAINSTCSVLEKHNIHNVRIFLNNHLNIDVYAAENSADAVLFNLGYLPGGDHFIATSPQFTIPAIEKGLRILKPGGIMSLCIYSGADSGFAEKNALMRYLKTIDKNKYMVCVHEFYNLPNNPPLPVFIEKL
ncbi:MAG: class I SAM-dependent methyltransferase [Oscillospiraceae bacterium]|nr:class I SAM-dependent methyltransferase [Oscillospiraceae bacterium]